MSANGKKNTMSATIGKGFLDRLFGGKSFTHCLIELIKNARDWGADRIQIMTGPGIERLVVLDNGNGMNKANRNAFISISTPTASQSHQSGKFCTGTKQTLFSQAVRVTVRTVSNETPDLVFRFSFSTDEYEALVLSKGTLNPDVMEKTAESWPYDFPTGTEITYELREPRRRDIKRGEALANELAARLPNKFVDFLLVDGRPLPPKDIIGELFRHTEEHPQLGLISIELYRPRKRAQDEDLRLTGVEIGEIPVNSFYRALGDLQDKLPSVLMQREVCGTISARYLKDHANEDRQTVRPDVSDDPRTTHFLRILQLLAPDIERSLQLQVSKADGASENELRRQIVSILNSRYKGPGGNGPESPPDDTITEPPPPKETPALRLKLQRHEFEPGEEFTVSAVLRADLLKRGHTLADIHWTTHNSRCHVVSDRDGVLVLRANDLGDGVIQADLRGTPIFASTKIVVVSQRVFRLSLAQAQITVGSQLILTGINADKLKGAIGWKLNGLGELSEAGARATYTAQAVCRATVVAWDRDDPKQKATCDITVDPKSDGFIRIRQHSFTLDYVKSDGVQQEPVRIERMNKVHRITVNTSGLGYQAALERGSIQEFTLHALALEYGRFVHMDLGSFEEYDFPRDLSVLADKIKLDGFSVLEELAETWKGKS